ncbi:unnamed protein product [Rotaria sp. Silwood2]|nr:unnamed protein product [Rotaria sp. Silwood2]CAF4447385.1 unnamed protein product [Rotaria sp. Silwood2]
MSNLEKLGLYFVGYNKLIVDGNELEKNIINHMTKLKKIIFNIRSIIPFHNQINLLSNEDIQYTFRNFKGSQVISCIDYFPEVNACHCHIYSYPYTLTYYNDITNNFPGGLFKCVREVSLFDERPFEHEFFLQIAQSFPFMKKLSLCNRKPQKNDNQQWSIIEYPYLITLDIVQTHENYVEQFLNSTKTCLPNNHPEFFQYEKVNDQIQINYEHKLGKFIFNTYLKKVDDNLEITFRSDPEVDDKLLVPFTEYVKSKDHFENLPKCIELIGNKIDNLILYKPSGKALNTRGRKRNASGSEETSKRASTSTTTTDE